MALERQDAPGPATSYTEGRGQLPRPALLGRAPSQKMAPGLPTLPFTDGSPLPTACKSDAHGRGLPECSPVPLESPQLGVQRGAEAEPSTEADVSTQTTNTEVPCVPQNAVSCRIPVVGKQQFQFLFLCSLSLKGEKNPEDCWGLHQGVGTEALLEKCVCAHSYRQV